jgi:molecular chaperone DnaK
MQAASQQMYSQAGGAQAGPGAGFNGAQGGAQPGGNAADDVQDADFEEVK